MASPGKTWAQWSPLYKSAAGIDITAVPYLNEVVGGVEIAGEKYKLELKLFDDASDPARATTLIQRQIDEGTNFFLGSFGSNIVLPTGKRVVKVECSNARP